MRWALLLLVFANVAFSYDYPWKPKLEECTSAKRKAVEIHHPCAFSEITWPTDFPADKEEYLNQIKAGINYASVILARPHSRAFFKNTYGIDVPEAFFRTPAKLSFRNIKPTHIGPFYVNPAGMYDNETGEVTLNTRTLRLMFGAYKLDRVVGLLIIHELSHHADIISDGVNDNGRLPQSVEEGNAAVREASKDMTPCPGSEFVSGLRNKNSFHSLREK